MGRSVDENGFPHDDEDAFALPTLPREYIHDACIVDARADAFKTQVGGDHYTSMKIQPTEYILANGIGYPEGNVIKYVSRWRAKNGVADLKKARHYLDLLIAHEEGKL